MYKQRLEVVDSNSTEPVQRRLIAALAAASGATKGAGGGLSTPSPKIGYPVIRPESMILVRGWRGG